MPNLKDVVQWVTQHPRTVFVLGVAATSPFVNYWLKEKASADLIQPALKKLETGSKPPLPIKSIEKMIRRPSLAKEIFNLFYPSDSNRGTCFWDSYWPLWYRKDHGSEGLLQAIPKWSVVL